MTILNNKSPDILLKNTRPKTRRLLVMLVTFLSSLIYCLPALAQNVTVAFGTTLTIPSSTTLSIPGNLTINAGGTVVNNGTISLGGNLTNNGAYSGSGSVDLNTNTVAVLSGTSPTPVANIILNKGSIGTTVTVSGSGIISVSGILTMTMGSLVVNAGGTFNKTGAITISSNANVTVNGGTFTQTGATVTNNGSFIVNSGTANIGTSSGNSFLNQSSGSFQVNGGTFNVAGRLENTGSVAITGGLLTVNAVGNASGTGSFNMSASSNLNMTSGTVILQGDATNDIVILAGGIKTITGGTFQLGNTLTGSGAIFSINSAIPVFNLTINSTNLPQATLASSLTVNGVLTMNGGNLNPTPAFALLVNNTAPSAVVRTSGFVNGKIKWQLPASVIPAGSYIFPVGKNTTYLPYTLVNPAGNSPAITVEAFDAGSGGTSNFASLSQISNTEYWEATFTGIYTGGLVTLTRPSPVSPFDVIGRNTIAANSSYSSIGGSPAGTSIAGGSTGASLGYFVMAQSCVPAGITCPSNITVNSSTTQCGAIVNYAATPSGSPTPTISYSIPSGSFFPVGTTSVTATATNSCGTASCTFTVTVVDNVPPIALCKNITVQLDATGNILLHPTLINNGSSDNCAASMSVSPTSLNCSNVSSGTSVATGLFFSEYVEGSSNNKYIEIYNGTGASVNLAQYELRLYANGAAAPTTTNVLSGTLVNGATVVYKNSAATIYAGAATTQSAVNWNGDDAIALFNTVTSQNVDIFGRIGDDPGAAWTGAGGYSTENKTLRRKASVTSGVTVSPSGTGPGAFTTLTTQWDLFNQDDVAGLGAHNFTPPPSGTTVTLIVTDIYGNSSTCTSIVTVQDVTPPTAICQNLTVSLSAAGTSTITAAQINNGSSDACGIATTTVNPSSFTCLNVGANTVVLTVTDVNGNSSTCTSTVTIQDVTPPTAVCQNLTVQLNAAGTASITAAQVNNGSSDACGIQSMTVSPSTFTCANVGGTSSVATGLFFSEYVEGSGNNKYIEIYNGTGAAVNLSDYELRLYSNGSSAISSANLLTGTLANGSTVVYKNTGALIYGGVSTTLSAVNWNGDDAIALYNTVTSENVDIFGRIGDDPGTAWIGAAGYSTLDKTLRRKPSVISGVSTNPSGTGPGAFTTLNAQWDLFNVDDVADLGAHTFSPPSAATTVTLIVTDINGNSSTCTANVTIQDVTPPTAVCQNLTVSLSATGVASINATQIDNGSTDACGIATATINPSSFTCLNVGSNTIVLTVTDINGNSSTCTSTVTVQDVTPPIAVCQNVTVQLNAAGTASITAAQVNNGSSDACGIQSMTVSPSTFNCANVGGTSSVATGLFFSEYVEGSGSNKYIEIFNGTGATVNLAQYELRLYSNGSPTVSTTNILSGTLAIGASVVYKNTGATIYAGASTTLSAVNWNGDDAIALFNTVTSQNVDIFGRIGDDPGTAWTGAASYSTLDKTLRRKPTVTSGVTVNPSGTGPGAFTTLNTQWDLFNIDDVTGLGAHTFTPPSTASVVTLTVTDINGNSSTCTANVTVQDVTPPTAVCQNLTVSLNATGTASITAAQINNGSSDACGIATTSINPSSFTCLNVGANTVVLTVTDVNGNSSTCTSIVTVQDNVAPIALCQNVTVQLNASGNGSVTAAQVNNGSNDACGIQSLTVSPSTFTCANVGTNTVVLTVTDVNGNTSTCTSVVTVQDNVAPIALCQNVTVQLSATGTASVTATQVNNGSSDNCTIASVTVSPSSFTCLNVGANTVTLTVTDVNGNSSTCTSTVTVQDNVAPIALCQNVTVQLNAAGTASVTAAQVNNGSSDNCTIATITVSPSSFTCLNVGSNTVTLTVTDVNGNSSTCSSTVSVQDNVAPIALCQNVTVQLNALGNGSATAAQVNNGSNDACGIQSLTVSPNTFTCANVGANTVILTVTDNNGNVSTCSSSVTVQDNVAPIALCQNVTVQLNALGNGSVTAAQVNNGSNDACGIQSLSVSPSSFTCANIGANTVILTVTDNNGNVSTCTSIVTVQDNVAPVALCQNVTVQLNALGNASVTAAQVNNGSNDACGIQSLSVSPNTFNCANVGANTVVLTVTDVNGNSSTCTSTVTVQDNVAPIALCQNVTVQLNSLGNGSVTDAQVNNGSNDACGIQSLSVSPNTFTCANVGANTVILTVTDNNGNVSTCSSTVTVQDNVAPVALCQNVTVQLNAAGTASVTPAQVNNGSNDACGIQSISVSPSNFVCSNLGSNIVILTVTDNNGNVSTCSSTVTVQDNIAPQISCTSNISAVSTPGICGTIITYPAPVASDNCTYTVALTAGLASGSVFPVGTTTNTFVVTDAAGNTASCSFNVTITDVQAPIIVNCPVSFSACNPVSWTVPTITDNCPGVQVISTHTPGTIFPPGTTTVTYTATDVYNNVSTCSFNVTVLPASIAADSITTNREYNNICVGDNITLSLNGGVLGNQAQWKWYRGGCGTGSGGVLVASNVTSITVAPTTTTTYYVRAEGTCNNTACQQMTVTVSAGAPTANINYLTVPAFGAPGVTSTITVNTIPGATYYRWTTNNGQINGVLFNGQVGPVETTVPTVQITFVLPQSNYQLRVTAGNACGRTNQANTHIRGTVPAPTSLTGPTLVCPGQTATYTVSAVPSANSYVWALIPASAGTISGSGLTRTITFAAGFTSAQLCVNGVSSFGLSGPAYCIAISNSAPSPVAVSGNPNPCQGSTGTYTTAAVTGATSYIWSTTVPGATISGTTTSASVVFPTGAFTGTICVRSVSACGTSAPTCMTVTSGAPGVPGPITGPVQGICNATNVNYAIAASAGAISYNWVMPAGASIASGGSSNSVNVNFLPGFTSGTITVNVTYACGTASSTLSVNGAPSVPVVNPATICPGTDELYFASAVGATSFNWTVTGQTYAECTNPPSCSQYYVIWGATGGSFSVTASNTCGTSAPLVISTNCRISESTELDSRVYPNPTSGMVTVEFTSASESNYTIRVTDLTGRELMVETVKSVQGLNQHEVNLTSVKKGIYMIHLTNEIGKSKITRLAVQ